MATKLDLAVAYRDIGDTDGARELLSEVVKAGDSVQVQKANDLLTDIG
jgi:pilus assembly protein FimV